MPRRKLGGSALLRFHPWGSWNICPVDGETAILCVLLCIQLHIAYILVYAFYYTLHVICHVFHSTFAYYTLLYMMYCVYLYICII